MVVLTPFRALMVAGMFIAPTTLLASSSEVDLIRERRKMDFSQFSTKQLFDRIPRYLETQSSEGIWPDVIYTSGCAAQTANWPIQQHWNRIITFAAAWSGLNPDAPANWTGSDALLSATKKGMDWWFARDFDEIACMGRGGVQGSACTCDTPGLWNQNWYCQTILIPQLVTTACLLIYDTNLTEAQRTGCHDIPQRAYELSTGAIPRAVGGGPLFTGSNAINVAQNSLSMALYTDNNTLFAESFKTAFSFINYTDAQKEDGIHRDGSFLQHDGILYSANYGKDVINIFTQLEGEAIGTSFAADQLTRDAIATQIKGNEWMIFVDESNKQEHWDYNVIGRFVAFPTYEEQGVAVADINFNVSKLATATADFVGENSVNDTLRRLLSNGTEKLIGNKGFWASDYMVHRRDNVIITNKMISNKSVNSEYITGANPYGFHLGQGTLYLYKDGTEYVNIMGSWDWNLVPGRTSVLNYPTLKSSVVTFTGTKNYVGVVSDGWVGTSVEDYTDPHNFSLSYKKAWFFLDDTVLVTTTQVMRNASVVNATGPVITVLDNRKATTGGVWADGAIIDASKNISVNATTLYYGTTGYLSYDTPFQLTVSESNRTGNWSALGTSTQGVVTTPIFSAYTVLPQIQTYSYLVLPVTTPEKLVAEASLHSSIALDLDGVIGAAGQGRLSLVFWPSGTNHATVPVAAIGWGSAGTITVSSSEPAAYLFAVRTNADNSRTLVVTVAEPTQLLDHLSFSLSISTGIAISCVDSSSCSSLDDGIEFDVQLPSGGLAGSSSFFEAEFRTL